MADIVPNVRVLIPNVEDRVLILRRSMDTVGAGLWCLPGGTVDFGNYITQTGMKEVKEETGLQVRNLEELAWTEEIHSEDKRGTLKHYMTFYLLSHGFSGQVKINGESTDHHWINPYSEDELQLYPFAFLNDEAIRRYVLRRKGMHL